jgi:CHASE2 domain-containing sensor protein
MTTSSSLPRIVVTVLAIHLRRSGLVSSCLQGRSSVWNWEQEAYFFITWTLTFCMSTFWLNSGGNLVLLRSLASTPVAMIAGVGCLGQGGRWICRIRWCCVWKAMMSLGAVVFHHRGQSGAWQRGRQLGCTVVAHKGLPPGSLPSSFWSENPRAGSLAP